MECPIMRSWFGVKLISELGSSITSQQLEVFLEEISSKQMHIHIIMLL